MDIPRLDAWSLHCFVVLVRESNVTRAGAVLGLSQPATSAILARLRELFHDPILVKTSSTMVPTSRAIRIAARAQVLLDEMREVLKPTEPEFDALAFTGNIAIAATDYMRLLLIPPMMRMLQEKAPGLTVTVHNADRTRIYERLERADVDIGLGPQVVTSGRLHYCELWRDKASCLVRNGRKNWVHPLSPEEFAGMGHIRVVPSRPSYFDDMLDKALLPLGLRRRVILSERSFLMLPCILEATDLIATVPARFASYACQRNHLSMFEPQFSLGEMSLGLFWHDRIHKEPLFRWLRERICELTITGTALRAGPIGSEEATLPAAENASAAAGKPPAVN